LPTWWTYTPSLLPLTPLTECKRLRERSLPAPRRGDPDTLVATLWPRQLQLLHSASARPGRSRHHRQWWVSRPHWSLLASLLNNPPLAHASPSAVEQWRHDVDQLVTVAINTSAAHALPSDRVPHQARVLPSIVTVDLRDELIRHCRGEDSRITIERHRKRHRNVEGCNLERDFESLAPAREAPATCAMRSPSSPGGSGVCMVLAPYLRMVVWLHKF
jgi:hypothetical protein